MTRQTDYTNEAQQRLLQIIDLLAGHEVLGLPPSEIARAVGCGAATVTRDMANLQHAGWAERTPKGERWRLSPHPIQISVRCAAGWDEAKKDLQDIAQRYGRRAA